MPSHWHLNVLFKTVTCILLFFRFLILLRHGFSFFHFNCLVPFIILILSSVLYFLFVLLLLLTHRGKKQYFDCPELFLTFSVDIISTLTTNKSCLTSLFLFFYDHVPFYYRLSYRFILELLRLPNSMWIQTNTTTTLNNNHYWILNTNIVSRRSRL